MFETLQKGFRKARQRMAGVAEIDEKVVDEALRDIRLSLLEADVDLKLTKDFLGRVREKALGEIVKTTATVKGRKLQISPTDAFVKICQDELVAMMGPVDTEIALAPKGTPTGIMMVGLNGVGKTTTTGKLARFLEKKGMKPLLCAADVYRPAAIEQLQVLAGRLNLPIHADFESKDPVAICEAAMREARRLRRDVVLFDTAGRQTVDEALMQELFDIKKTVKPKNIFLVADAMIGQDAVKTAGEFHKRLDLSGVILTKLDGDARGGAAISIKETTGAPIKFLGIGEGLDKLEEFRPEGLASRILGMGDVVGLVKDFEEVVDADKAERDARRMLRGNFTMIDFLDQMQAIKKMGSFGDLLDKLPFFPDGLPDGMKVDDREIVKIESIIHSMTRGERIDVGLFDKQPGRIERVAKGSGREAKDIRSLIDRFKSVRDMMGAIGQQAGLLSKIPGMKQLAMARKLKGAMAQGGMPGLPGMPGMPGMPGGLTQEMLQAAVADAPPLGKRRAQSAGSKAKAKAKRKQVKKARKKSRR
ncbi:MAG: signal recognition particle protein Srp54 [Proteobacteria bacterium]|jgi:signal recognition particle subunit SRP54|nr:signal recognition particle protein Srp54 [Pseudomonadota bacterium]